MSEDKEKYKSRHLRYLLYEDNEQHMQVLDKIKADNFPFIGIKHHVIDIDGVEVLEGEGKPHYHVYQEFEYPRYPSALAKRYGLLDDSGKVSVQFVRCIHKNEGAQRFYNSWNGALCYLTHLNAPDKELYPESDLFGWDSMKSAYRAASIAYSDKTVDLRTALTALMWWVNEQNRGKIIKSSDVVAWLVTTPFLRFRNERLFLSAIQEHNQEVWAYEARQRMDGYQQGQIQLNSRCVGYDDDAFREMSELEWEQIRSDIHD